MIGGFLFVLIVFLIIGVICSRVFTGYQANDPTNRTEARKGPLDIAKERYAKGEITRDEYNRLKEDLSD